MTHYTISPDVLKKILLLDGEIVRIWAENEIPWAGGDLHIVTTGLGEQIVIDEDFISASFVAAPQISS